jgi:diguanylate cyclase (GGDEF)-like protein
MSAVAANHDGAGPGARLSAWRWLAHVVLGGLGLAYIGLLVVRSPGNSSTLIDGWGVDALELAAGVLCLLAPRRHGRARFVPALLGAGVLCWAAGDVVATAMSLGGRTVPSPGPPDACYLAFFPLAYAGVALLARLESRRLTSQYVLDGAVAGLGAAAVCAAVVFASVADATHRSTLGTAVHLAYPVGDVLLLLVVAAGAAVTTGRRAPWLLLAAAFTANALGDVSNLLQTTSHLGLILNAAAWPASMVLVAAAMWLDPGLPDPAAAEQPAGFVLPGLAAGAGLVLLFMSTLASVNHVATALATATLLAVVLRTGLSVRELRRQSRLRHEQSRIDPLTGLANRRRLFDTLDALHAGAPEQRPQIAFLFIDLNGFKQVNDSFGHAVGDGVLREVAYRLTKSLRPKDLVVRIGGDEFGAVLSGADAEEPGKIAARIATRLAEPFMLGAVTAEIRASIGIALANDTADAAALLEHADAAMYEAKLERLPFTFYHHELDGGAPRLRMADELSAAINTGQLLVHYQPQLDLHDDRIASVEALVRWRHPEHGLIAPTGFLPLAVEAGLMGRLTRWVLAAALRECARWHADGRPLRVSVNVSVGDLLDPTLPALVGELLDREQLGADSLTIEITETSIIDEFERAQAAVEGLRDLGVEVSVDDFGAGFTSLAYLSDLAVDELKLDRRFIIPLAGGATSRDSEVVRVMIDLGHALGMRVVAEGVEDAATLELLRSFGCDLAQGFGVGRPVAAAELSTEDQRAATGRRSPLLKS